MIRYRGREIGGSGKRKKREKDRDRGNKNLTNLIGEDYPPYHRHSTWERNNLLVGYLSKF